MGEGSLRELLRTGREREQQTASAQDSDEYRAFSCGRAGNRAMQMICFVKSDGYHTVLPYIDLHAITSPEPSRGFILDFGSREVVVEGENLQDCFNFVRAHRLMELIELQHSATFQTPDGEPLVHTLTIRKPKKHV